jgi:type II secretory pathway predicted ATPase ExeA
MTMTIEDPLKHLDEKAQQKLLLSDEERIRSILVGTWVGIEHVKEVLDRLEDILQSPEVTRPPCMLVVGPAFSGKTSIAEHFVSMHPPDLSPDNETTVAPVVMIDAPPKPDLSDFYSRILDKLMAPYKPTASSHEKYAQVKRLFRELGVRMLIVDEIHHLIAGSLNRQREFRNAIKSLSNETKVSLVVLGIEEARAAIYSDEQFSSRFIPYELPMWSNNKAFSRLLRTMERRTPLGKPSNLGSPDMANIIYSKSESNLGDIFDLVKEASVMAIRNGSECITRELLDSMKWVPPSKRKLFRRKL